MRDATHWPRLAALLLALGLAVAGCATIRAAQAPSTEEGLVAAGFNVKAADTPEKLAHLQSLPAWKLVRLERDGAPYYVYADPRTCRCLYVGGEPQYQAYQKLRTGKDIAERRLDASMNWGLWAPWPWF